MCSKNCLLSNENDSSGFVGEKFQSFYASSLSIDSVSLALLRQAAGYVRKRKTILPNFLAALSRLLHKVAIKPRDSELAAICY